MRSLVRAVYRFRDATLVAEKKDDFGNSLQNLYRELERAEDLLGPGWSLPLFCSTLTGPVPLFSHAAAAVGLLPSLALIVPKLSIRPGRSTRRAALLP